MAGGYWCGREFYLYFLLLLYTVWCRSVALLLVWLSVVDVLTLNQVAVEFRRGSSSCTSLYSVVVSSMQLSVSQCTSVLSSFVLWYGVSFWLRLVWYWKVFSRIFIFYFKTFERRFNFFCKIENFNALSKSLLAMLYLLCWIVSVYRNTLIRKNVRL